MFSIGQAYKDFWKNYVNFKGKTTRAGFWWAVLINILIIVGFVCLTIIGLFMNCMAFWITTLLLMTIFLLAIFIPNLTLLCRRIQDLDISFEIALILTIIISILKMMLSSFFFLGIPIIIIVLACLPTDIFSK